jgi:hypothetical protein
MSTKSRQVIHGDQIIGAKIRAEGARKRAAQAIRDADPAEAEAWSIQMEAYGGPAQPSPTIAQWWIQLVAGRMPPLRNRGQHPARRDPASARHADLETRGGA